MSLDERIIRLSYLGWGIMQVPRPRGGWAARNVPPTRNWTGGDRMLMAPTRVEIVEKVEEFLSSQLASAENTSTWQPPASSLSRSVQESSSTRRFGR